MIEINQIIGKSCDGNDFQTFSKLVVPIYLLNISSHLSAVTTLDQTQHYVRHLRWLGEVIILSSRTLFEYHLRVSSSTSQKAARGTANDQKCSTHHSLQITKRPSYAISIHPAVTSTVPPVTRSWRHAASISVAATAVAAIRRFASSCWTADVQTSYTTVAALSPGQHVPLDEVRECFHAAAELEIRDRVDEKQTQDGLHFIPAFDHSHLIWS